ncbi:hypothetical protein [Loigolactobacillus zhaoyuanensis]|uniref:Cell division protein FtsX n=1 Tax=Loigolactobacillus zhaoyuanensis TaxID=2486017 RepID=A0ABW8UJI6_9LACO
MNLPSRSQARKQNVIAAPPKRHGGVAVLLSFLAVVSLLLAVGTGVARQRVFNADYLVTELDKTDAGKQLAIVANAELTNVVTDRGLPSTLAPQLVTTKAAQQDLDQSVRNLVAGTSQPISVSHIVAHAQSTLTTKLNQQSALLAEFGATSTLVKGLTNTLDTRLTNELNVTQVTAATQKIKTIHSTVNIIFWSATALTVILLAILLWLDHNVFRFAKQFGWITLSSGVIIFIGYFGVSAAGIIELVAVRAKVFGTAAAAVGNAVLNSYAVPSYILIGLGVVSLLLSLLGRRRKN